jgi:hypothetical protein
MNTFRIAAAAAMVAISVPLAVADQWNKMTKVTFGQSVSVPGAVLPPGTYVFKLEESSSNRHIVRIQNQRQNKTLATILAIPDYRLNASSKTVMYFGERGRTDINGNPMAIKSWFYPGDNFGQRFVYPRKEASAIAAVYNQPVPTSESPTTSAASANLTMTTPEKTETEYKSTDFDKADSQDTAGVQGEAVVAQAEPAPAAAPESSRARTPEAAPAPEMSAKRLPSTNSPLPLMAGLGTLLLAGSGFVRFVSSRIR